MTIKLLLDCVVTAEPGKCSSNIQFLTFARRVLETTDDVFLYWMIPDWVTDEDMEKVYPKSDRVRYFKVKQHKDRTKEYLTMRPEFDMALAFNGDMWDFDAVVTMRSGLVPLMKLLITSPRHFSLAWMKRIILIEEMPLMKFKTTVMTIDPHVQDAYTLMGYRAADKVYLLSYHEKKEIMQAARVVLAPSEVKAIGAKIFPVCTIQFNDFALKDPKDRYVPGGKKPFCIAYVGRMEMANRIEDVNSMMVNQFVMKGDKVRLLACTQSRAIKEFDESVVDVRMAQRDEFWSLAKHDMDLLVNLCVDGGFSLSLLEPMMFGTPALVAKKPWATELLGPHFPFYVEGEAQAYAYASMFFENYDKMYAIFVDWQEKHFKPLFEARFKTDLLYDLLLKDVEDLRGIEERFKKERPGKAENAFVMDVVKTVGKRKEFVLEDIIKEMTTSGVADKTMAAKISAGDRDRRHLIWSTGWNEFRLALKAFHGWQDASTKTGHFKRV